LVASSEDCVFAEGSLNCTLVGEVLPGYLVKLDPRAERHNRTEKDDKGDDGTIEAWMWRPKRFLSPKHCIFYAIYFFRPDGTFVGRNVKTIQERAGEKLAEQHLVAADVVIPVNDSGLAAAMGYARKSGIPLDPFGLFRPHTVGRTFMEPHQHLREEGVGKKHRVIPEVVFEKRVVVVDDSLVRGTTMKRLVGWIFKAGAREVHVRIASPPIRYPCAYGIDVPTFEELAWHKCGGTKEGVRMFIGAISLEYLDSPADNIAAALETRERHRFQYFPVDEESFCTQCFDGKDATSGLRGLVK